MVRPCGVSASYFNGLVHLTAFFFQLAEQRISSWKCVRWSVGCQGLNRFLWRFFTELVVKSRFETRIFTHNTSKTQALVKTVGVNNTGAGKNDRSQVKLGVGPVCEAAVGRKHYCYRELVRGYLCVCMCVGGGGACVRVCVRCCVSACVLAFVFQETRTSHISPKSTITYFWLRFEFCCFG